MEGSNYEDKCGQQTDDVGGMSNHMKRKISPRKGKIRVNCNSYLQSKTGLNSIFRLILVNHALTPMGTHTHSQTCALGT